MSELPKQVKEQPVEAVKKLLYFLKQQKINQKMVAEKIGKDPSSLSQLIHSKDRSIPKTLEYFRMICAAYQVQVKEGAHGLNFHRTTPLNQKQGDEYYAYAFWNWQNRISTAALVVNINNGTVRLTFYDEKQQEVLMERKGIITETDRSYVILLGKDSKSVNSMILVAHGKLKGVHRQQPPILLMGTYTGVRFNDNFNMGGRVLLKRAANPKVMLKLMEEMRNDPQLEALLYRQRVHSSNQSIYDKNMLDKVLKWKNRSKDLEGVYHMYHRVEDHKQVSQCLLHILPGGICQLVDHDQQVYRGKIYFKMGNLYATLFFGGDPKSEELQFILTPNRDGSIKSLRGHCNYNGHRGPSSRKEFCLKILDANTIPRTSLISVQGTGWMEKQKLHPELEKL